MDDFNLFPQRIPAGQNFQVPQERIDILTAGCHFLFRPHPLPATLKQQGRDALLHRPAIKSVLSSGANAVRHGQTLCRLKGCTIDSLRSCNREKHQRAQGFVAISAVQVRQQIRDGIERLLQRKGQPKGQAPLWISGKDTI